MSQPASAMPASASNVARAAGFLSVLAARRSQTLHFAEREETTAARAAEALRLAHRNIGGSLGQRQDVTDERAFRNAGIELALRRLDLSVGEKIDVACRHGVVEW